MINHSRNSYSKLIVLILCIILPLKLTLANQTKVKNVIIMVSDGFAPAGVTLGRYVKGENLTLDSLLVGTVQTKSYDSLITDSAASATAYATGFKTNNKTIGLHPETNLKLKNIMEAAREKNMSTGLVATDSITGATPAAFSSHVLKRNMDDAISKQQIAAGFDVILGGGLQYFLPRSQGGKRNDGVNLITKAQEYGTTVIQSYEDFKNIKTTPVLGLFAADELSYEIDRDPTKEPSLTEMTAKALNLLSQNDNGFVLMIEGSRIDHAAHSNDPAAFAKEIISYDHTIALVKKFVQENPGTLMISVSDHATGGITVGRDVNGSVAYKYNPDVLKQIKHSAVYLEQMLDDGYSVDEVIAASGLDDLSSKDINKIKANSNPVTEILRIINERSRTGWTTYGHTAIDVNLYAYGTGSEEFRGNQDNTVINHKLTKILGINLV